MKNQLKAIFLLGVLSALLIGVGSALGDGYLYGAIGFAVLMNFGTYFFSDRLVLAMHRAHEIPREQAPKLHAMVEELSQRAGIPKPKVYLIPEAVPNAFATGRNPEHGVVAVTSGIMNLLSERELRGVIAHELAHIKNRDILVATMAATVAAALTYLAHYIGFFGGALMRGDDEEGPSPAQTILLALVAPIAATLIQLGISRSREYLADETGAKLADDPNSLADALERLEMGVQQIPHEVQPATASLFIVSPLAGTQSIMNLFSTHPRLEERVKKLRAMGRGGWARSSSPSMEWGFNR